MLESHLIGEKLLDTCVNIFFFFQQFWPHVQNWKYVSNVDSNPEKFRWNESSRLAWIWVGTCDTFHGLVTHFQFRHHIRAHALLKLSLNVLLHTCHRRCAVKLWNITTTIYVDIFLFLWENQVSPYFEWVHAYIFRWTCVCVCLQTEMVIYRRTISAHIRVVGKKTVSNDANENFYFWILLNPLMCCSR